MQDNTQATETKKLFVGNLPFATTKEELMTLGQRALEGETNAAGEPIGTITDAYKPEMKGFGFITCSTEEAAQKLIEKLNGTEFGGRELAVNLARPRAPRPAGSYQDRGGRGSYGNRGGYNNNRSGGYNRDRGYNRDGGDRGNYDAQY